MTSQSVSALDILFPGHTQNQAAPIASNVPPASQRLIRQNLGSAINAGQANDYFASTLASRSALAQSANPAVAASNAAAPSSVLSSILSARQPSAAADQINRSALNNSAIGSSALAKSIGSNWSDKQANSTQVQKTTRTKTTKFGPNGEEEKTEEIVYEETVESDSDDESDNDNESDEEEENGSDNDSDNFSELDEEEEPSDEETNREALQILGSAVNRPASQSLFNLPSAAGTGTANRPASINRPLGVTNLAGLAGAPSLLASGLGSNRQQQQTLADRLSSLVPSNARTQFVEQDQLNRAASLIPQPVGPPSVLGSLAQQQQQQSQQQRTLPGSNRLGSPVVPDVTAYLSELMAKKRLVEEWLAQINGDIDRLVSAAASSQAQGTARVGPTLPILPGGSLAQNIAGPRQQTANFSNRTQPSIANIVESARQTLFSA